MTSLYKFFYNTKDKIFYFNTNNSFVLGTIGKSVNTIDYTNDLAIVRNQEIDLLSKLLSLDKHNIIMLNQVHGDSILEFNAPSKGNRVFPDADGMITTANKICLVIRSADCVPVFAFDVKQKVLGAAHSGWKGCSLNITRKLIEKMKSGFKSKANDIHIFILPSIGPDSYTVNMDVGSLFKNAITIKDNKIYLNLWNNIVESIIEEGISASNIHKAEICSFINNADFFSYRRGDIGRNLNFAMINNPDS
jgi:YfiH family protein